MEVKNTKPILICPVSGNLCKTNGCEVGSCYQKTLGK